MVEELKEADVTATKGYGKSLGRKPEKIITDDKIEPHYFTSVKKN